MNFTHENETKQMTVFVYTEYLSVLEEQCSPTQLHPLTLGPPTRHVQTRNKFVSITTGVYWQQDTLCLRVRGWGVLVHPGNQACWHGNNTGGVQLVLQESPALEGAAFKQEITNLEGQYNIMTIIIIATVVQFR